MGTFKFSMMMLKKELTRSIFYGLTLIFTVTICFVFSNIINNNVIMDQAIIQSGSTWNEVSVPLTRMLAFCVILFCCFMMFFANSFFLQRKTTELAIIAMSGSGYISSTLYILYQTLALLLVCAPLGFLLGRFIVPFVNSYIYSIMNIHESVNVVMSGTYFFTFILVMVVLAMICIITSGYIHRHDILALLSQENKIFHGGRVKGRKAYIWLVLYVLGICMMFMSKHSQSAYIVPTLMGCIAISGMISFTIPFLIKKLEKGFLLKKKYALIAISNFNYSMQRSSLLFSLITICSTGMMAILASAIDSPREFAVTKIGYVVIMILLVVSLIYKLSLEATTRKVMYNNLWKIGYTRKELKKIIREELIFYYITLMIIPMIYILFIAGRYMYHGQMTVSFLVFFVLSFVVPILISSLVTYRQYVSIVIKPIRGGNENG